MTNVPTVSIVIPAYNCELYIGECLASLQAQSFADFEALIIDDGSSDKTADVAREYMDSDQRFKLIQTGNNGVSHARNVALNRASGEFILFVDADDCVASDYVATLIDPFASDDCGCTACGIVSCSEDDDPRFTDGEKIEYKGTEAQVSMLDKPRGFLCNKGFRASLIAQENIRLDENVAQSEDMLFLLDYLSLCDKVVYDSGSKYCYRQHRGSATNNADNPRWLDVLKVFEAYKNRFSQNDGARQAVADNFLLIAYEAVYRASRCGVPRDVRAASRDMVYWCEDNVGRASLLTRIKRMTYKHAMFLVMAHREKGLR